MVGAREFKDISLSEVWNGDPEKTITRNNVNNNFVRATGVDRFRKRNT
jgi:hypothetical protein